MSINFSAKTPNYSASQSSKNKTVTGTPTATPTGTCGVTGTPTCTCDVTGTPTATPTSSINPTETPGALNSSKREGLVSMLTDEQVKMLDENHPGWVDSCNTRSDAVNLLAKEDGYKKTWKDYQEDCEDLFYGNPKSDAEKLKKNIQLKISI